MAGTTYTPNLQFDLPGIGDPLNANNWGTLLNTGTIGLLDTALVGVVSINLASAAGSYSLQATAGAPDQSRYQVYQFTGALTQNTTVYWPLALQRAFTVSNQTTGGFTLTLAVTTPAGGMQGITQTCPAGYTLDYISDGTNILNKSYSQSLQYSFNAVSPPSAIFLNPGDNCTITFSGIDAVPLNINTTQGLYRITLIVTETTSTNNDIALFPNNTSYTGAFNDFGTSTGDLYLGAWGSATSNPGFGEITVEPWFGSVPYTYQSNVTPSSLNYFSFEGTNGPSSDDTINSHGPQVLEIIASTYTLGKMCKARQGVAGGPGLVFCLWRDTTTAWTSLGTFELTATPGVNITGTCFVERLM